MSALADTDYASPSFSFRRSFTNSQKIIANLLRDIRSWMEQINLPNGIITNVQIALGEALNNIIEHGFQESDCGTIELEIKAHKTNTVITLTDNGMEFVPPDNICTPVHDISDIDNLPEGGFGWFLINEITSSYSFSRVCNQNQLILNF
jgi:serine/threonine-protein kinase RsbW